MQQALYIFLGVAMLAGDGHACSVKAILSNTALVENADSIVRAKATAYAVRPSDPDNRTTGAPDSRVRFEVTESVRGQTDGDILLPGYLVRTDDFNDRSVPYTFVRPGGRSGNCFADSYRRDAEYLLFLKKNKDGEFTVNWAPLAPVNEQLRSADDPWLVWVRQQVSELRKTDPAKRPLHERPVSRP